jgi:hypothetical protein
MFQPVWAKLCFDPALLLNLKARRATVLYTPLLTFRKPDWRKITGERAARDLSKFSEFSENLEQKAKRGKESGKRDLSLNPFHNRSLSPFKPY